jgi:hypothetical protein
MKKQISCLLVSLFLIAGLSLPISASDSSALEKARGAVLTRALQGFGLRYELERQQPAAKPPSCSSRSRTGRKV